MELLGYVCLFTFAFSGLIVGSTALHGHLSCDFDTQSVQKFHAHPVPRIGGLALLSGLFFSMFFKNTVFSDAIPVLIPLLLASLPIFLVGLMEDITQRVSSRTRLHVSFLSAALVYFILHISFVRTGWEWFDTQVLNFPGISCICTLLVIGSSIHAMNVIDGFNGLMLGVSLLIFGALALVSFLLIDPVMLHISLLCFSAILGLFLLNFPFGKLFSGDSGAYLIGFLISTVTLMLIQRHKEISGWFACLLLGYPLFETIFSIYRKMILRKMSPAVPDGLHLHMLIYKRITGRRPRSKKMNNAMTSPYLWLLAAATVVPAVVFWDNTILILCFCGLFSIIYLAIYWQLVFYKRRIFFRNSKYPSKELL